MIMDESTSLQCLMNTQSSDRLFECPCGKTYKSYPALFTHIKGKHEGKAPGCIKKPVIPLKKRGRPPVHTKRSQIDANGQQSNPQNELSSQFSLIEQNKIIKQQVLDTDGCLRKIVLILQSLPRESINKGHLNEMHSIIQMNVYLVTKKNQQRTKSIGNIISQLLQRLTNLIDWSSFQQSYLLLMTFLQFIMDELNNNKIIFQGSIDLLCDYINDFLQHGVQGMIGYYQIDNLAIFGDSVMLQFFSIFFQWLMLGNYTDYKIVLNSHFKKMETEAEI